MPYSTFSLFSGWPPSSVFGISFRPSAASEFRHASIPPPSPQSGSQFVPCGWAGLFPPSSFCRLRSAPPSPDTLFPRLDFLSPSPARSPFFGLSVCGGGNAGKVCTRGHVLNSYSPPRLTFRGAKSAFCSRELFKKGKCGSLQRREIYLHSSFPLLKKVYKCH